jgi:putative MATE family efflux protein
MTAEQQTPVKTILKLALPIILGGIAQNVILATDVFFMARVDEVLLDAVGLAGLFYSTIYVLGLGFSTGVQILIARRHGEKNYHSVGTIFDNSFIFLVIFSLVLWVLMLAAGPLVLQNLISNDAVYQNALIYLDQRAWGIVFAMINLAFRALFIGISSPTAITLSLFATALSNVFLNDALIFGHWGFPEIGIAGAALASSLAEIAATLVFIGFTKRLHLRREFGVFKQWRIIKPTMKQVFAVSSPVMFQYFISHAGWFLFFIIIEQNGARALAISVVIRMIYMFQMVPFWGFSSATNTLVSFAIGEGRIHAVLPLLKRITIMSILASLPFILLNSIFPEWVIGLSLGSANDSLLNDCIPTLHVISIALFCFSIAMTWFSGVSGSGNTRTALWIETVTIIIYCVFAWFLGIFLQSRVEIIWLTEPFYFLILSLISLRYMISGNWKGKMI